MTAAEPVAEAALAFLDPGRPDLAPIRAALDGWLGRPHPDPLDLPAPRARRADLFEPAIEAARRGPGAELVAALETQRFRWTDYLPSPWAAPFVDRMATGMLVGPAAPILDHDVAFGVFVVDADTHYPEHAHAARELYLTLSGDPLFYGACGWAELGSGAASVQEPDVVHALRTRSRPALFFWVWAGEVDSRIYAFDGNGARIYPPNLRPVPA